MFVNCNKTADYNRIDFIVVNKFSNIAVFIVFKLVLTTLTDKGWVQNLKRKFTALTSHQPNSLTIAVELSCWSALSLQIKAFYFSFNLKFFWQLLSSLLLCTSVETFCQQWLYFCLYELCLKTSSQQFNVALVSLVKRPALR